MLQSQPEALMCSWCRDALCLWGGVFLGAGLLVSVQSPAQRNRCDAAVRCAVLSTPLLTDSSECLLCPRTLFLGKFLLCV